MPKSNAAKESAYNQALSLVLSLPETYWVRMKHDLDQASLRKYRTENTDPTHPNKHIDEISLNG